MQSDLPIWFLWEGDAKPTKVFVNTLHDMDDLKEAIIAKRRVIDVSPSEIHLFKVKLS
jgi:hypothetical protein